MSNLNKASARASVLRGISTATPGVNYEYKQKFVDAIRNEHYAEAWQAAYDAGRLDGRLDLVREKFAR